MHILEVQTNAEYKKYSENFSEFHRILQVIYTNVDDSYIWEIKNQFLGYFLSRNVGKL